MIKLYSLLLSILLSSCFTPVHNYLGNSYTPTKDVDVYVDASAIKRAYSVIGKSYVDIREYISLEKVQRATIKTAKQKGADAILFCDLFIQEGASVQTITQSDSTGGSSIRVRTTTAVPVETTRLDILFLKYEASLSR
jgi:hypothetical protein